MVLGIKLDESNLRARYKRAADSFGTAAETLIRTPEQVNIEMPRISRGGENYTNLIRPRMGTRPHSLGMTRPNYDMAEGVENAEVHTDQS